MRDELARSAFFEWLRAVIAGEASRLKRFPAIEHHRDRAVIDETHFHVGLKPSCLDVNPVPTDLIEKPFIKRESDFRPCRLDETRSAPFSTVPIEGELTDNQHRSAGLVDRPIHLPFIIFKDPQPADFSCEVGNIIHGVIRSDAKENEKAFRDLSDDLIIDANAGRRDSLKNRTHGQRIVEERGNTGRAACLRETVPPEEESIAETQLTSCREPPGKQVPLLLKVQQVNGISEGV